MMIITRAVLIIGGLDVVRSERNFDGTQSRYHEEPENIRVARGSPYLVSTYQGSPRGGQGKIHVPD